MAVKGIDRVRLAFETNTVVAGKSAGRSWSREGMSLS